MKSLIYDTATGIIRAAVYMSADNLRANLQPGEAGLVISNEAPPIPDDRVMVVDGQLVSADREMGVEGEGESEVVTYTMTPNGQPLPEGLSGAVLFTLSPLETA